VESSRADQFTTDGHGWTRIAEDRWRVLVDFGGASVPVQSWRACPASPKTLWSVTTWRRIWGGFSVGWNPRLWWIVATRHDLYGLVSRPCAVGARRPQRGQTW